MNKIWAQIMQQLRDLLRNVDLSNDMARKLLLFGGGWLVSIYMAIHPGSFLPGPVAVIAYFYFLFNLIDLLREVRTKIKQFSELLLIAFVLVYGLEYLLLEAFLPNAALSANGGAHGNFLVVNFQILLLAILNLIFAIVLVDNNEGKKGILVGIFFIGLAFGFYIDNGNNFIYYGILLVLFFTLIKRTAWLEPLTRNECWVYLVLVVLTFRGFSQFDSFDTIAVGSSDDYSNLWFIEPYFLFTLFKMYLLAVMLRIPGVLIYNHATLDRKLRIASLLQSTFPQLVQLVVMVLTFYLFIAGWQAQELRDTLQMQLSKIEAGEIDFGVDVHELPITKNEVDLSLSGYRPLVKRNSFKATSLPAKGIMEMRKHGSRQTDRQKGNDYFLFFKSLKADSSQSLFLVKVNPAFLSLLGDNLAYLGGSSLISYPVSTKNWPLYTDKIELWSGDRDIKILPFGLVSRDAPIATAVLPDASRDDDESIEINSKVLRDGKLTFGRVFLPVWSGEDKSGALFAVDIIQEFNGKVRWSGTVQVVLLIIFLYLVLNSLLIRNMVNFGGRINKMIVQKFAQLKSGIQEISSGNLDYKMKFDGQDEFVELSEHFNEMGTKLQQTLDERREKDRLQYELQNARDVQLGLLPRSLPEIPGYQVAASLYTATEVGGDFYDMFQLDDNRYLFAIGDVSGKGSSAALYMAQCLSLIRYSPQFTEKPLEICRRLNAFFTGSMVDKQIFVTAIVGILDTKKHAVSYVRAGHPQPILLAAGGEKDIRFLASKGLGIGLTPQQKIFDKAVEQIDIKMAAGDTLVFYTDGVIEASKPKASDVSTGDAQETYDEDRLKAKLAKLHGKTPQEIRSEIEFDLESFYAGHPRVDDYTLLVLKRG